MSTPTKERINELVTEITGDLHRRFEGHHPGRKRSDKMITYIIRELAFERAKNEILKNNDVR